MLQHQCQDLSLEASLESEDRRGQDAATNEDEHVGE